MGLVADVSLNPGGVISWIAVGLISGWLAGTIMSGGGFGIVRDIVLGLIGALVGGFLSGMLIQGDAGFWGSIVIAFIGACVLIAIARILAPGHAPRH